MNAAPRAERSGFAFARFCAEVVSEEHADDLHYQLVKHFSPFVSRLLLGAAMDAHGRVCTPLVSPQRATNSVPDRRRAEVRAFATTFAGVSPIDDCMEAPQRSFDPASLVDAENAKQQIKIHDCSLLFSGLVPGFDPPRPRIAVDFVFSVNTSLQIEVEVATVFYKQSQPKK